MPDKSIIEQGAKMQRNARLSGSPGIVRPTAKQNGREPWSSYSEPPLSILSGGQLSIRPKVLRIGVGLGERPFL